MNYEDLEQLRHYVLEESWVLDITIKVGCVVLSCDLVMTETHPSYRRPQKNEQWSYQKSLIVFGGVKQVSWNAIDSHPSFDSSGEADWGNIDDFTSKNGCYRLVGQFGRIQLEADSLKVERQSD